MGAGHFLKHAGRESHFSHAKDHIRVSSCGNWYNTYQHQMNSQYGRGTLRPLATGIARPWGTRAGMLTQRYTTHPGEMMQARAL